MSFRYFHTENAKPIQVAPGLFVEFIKTEIFAGSWRGVVRVPAGPLSGGLLQLSKVPNSRITEITDKAFYQLSKTEPEPIIHNPNGPAPPIQRLPFKPGVDEWKEPPPVKQDPSLLKALEPQKLCVVIPFSKVDHAQALKLLGWIKELGTASGSPCLLVADYALEKSTIKAIQKEAAKAFSSVDVVTTPFSKPGEKWPFGPNWMFQVGCGYIERSIKMPFWWNEPDCIPLKPGWIGSLETAYGKTTMNFMGCVSPSNIGKSETPYPTHLTGNAIYPANISRFIPDLYAPIPEAWDIYFAPQVLPYTAHTNLYQQVWGEWQQPPVFKTPSSLSIISREAVVFHRNKDGTLIDQLRARKK